MNIFDHIINLFYPKRCACCQNLIDTAFFCDNCARQLSRITYPKCKVCGKSKDKCKYCNESFSYTACSAPFYYSGIVKKGLWDFKFHGFKYASEAFGYEMAELAKHDFPIGEIDFICCVPMTKKAIRNRGYNQSYLLARNVGKHLSVPVIKRALIKSRETKAQHFLNMSERVENVKGVFVTDSSLDLKGKTAILCDDIKTTGNTLNVCSNALLAAGVKQIFCLCAAIAC